MLANRLSTIGASATSRMRTLAQELKAQGRSIVNFAAGELDFDTDEAIKAAAADAIRRGDTRYTDTLGLKELRALIAARVSREIGVPYLPEEIGVTSGAKQALYETAMALINPGDEVIVIAPYWVTFPAQVELAGGIPIFLDTSKTGFVPDPAALKRLISRRTKAIVINTPHNPTGQVYDRSILLEIASIARAAGCWVIFDECYASLVYKGAAHHNIVSLLPELKSRTVVINSFSKAFCLTGWRQGYMAAPKELVKAAGALQGHMTSNPSTVGQHAAIAALKGGDLFVTETRRKLTERRELALRELRGIPGVSFPEPRGAFYVFLDVGAYLGSTYDGRNIRTVDDFTELLLSSVGVSVVPGTAFGHATSVRISYAVSEKDIVDGLHRFGEFIARIKVDQLELAGIIS